MFDAGACKVEVWDPSGQVFIGTLAKGGTSQPFTANQNNTYTVSVDATGVVTLSSVEGWPDGMSMYVDPQYDTSALATRVRDISAWEDGTHPAASASGEAQCDDQSQTVALSFVAVVADPATVEFTAHSPPSGIASGVGVSVANAV